MRQYNLCEVTWLPLKISVSFLLINFLCGLTVHQTATHREVSVPLALNATLNDAHVLSYDSRGKRRKKSAAHFPHMSAAFTLHLDLPPSPPSPPPPPPLFWVFYMKTDCWIFFIVFLSDALKSEPQAKNLLCNSPSFMV